MNYETIYEKITKIVIEYLRVNEDEVKPTTNLVEDLFIDSIAMVELAFRFSEEFKIPMLDGNQELYIMENLAKHIYDLVENK